MRAFFQNSRHATVRQQGFGLIEVMVGILIGLAAVIVMMRLMLDSDTARRTTAGGNDALVNATVALYGLERDVRSSAFGINAFAILGCNLSFTTSQDSASVSLPLSPTTINPASSLVPAGDSDTDTLLVITSTNNGSSEGDALIATSVAGTYQVTSPGSFAVGDYVVAQNSTRPSPCTLPLNQVSVIDSSTAKLTVANNTVGLGAGSLVFNLGKTLSLHAYAVRNGNLTQCDYLRYNCGSSSYTSTLDSTVWVPVASNIVALRAQYGRDTSTVLMDGTLDTYDQTTPGSSADTSGLNLYCAWSRVLTLRMAVVARSPQYDKTLPTNSAPVWDGSAVSTSAPTNSSAAPIVLSGLTDWTAYRYRLASTVVPLRDMIWSGSQINYQGGTTGC